MKVILKLIRENLVIPLFKLLKESRMNYESLCDVQIEKRFYKNFGCSLNNLKTNFNFINQ
jgi:hypothetical protein